jgi:hypothetical protein
LNHEDTKVVTKEEFLLGDDSRHQYRSSQPCHAEFNKGIVHQKDAISRNFVIGFAPLCLCGCDVCRFPNAARARLLQLLRSPAFARQNGSATGISGMFGIGGGAITTGGG